jgi:hypothetical protein
VRIEIELTERQPPAGHCRLPDGTPQRFEGWLGLLRVLGELVDPPPPDRSSDPRSDPPSDPPLERASDPRSDPPSDPRSDPPSDTPSERASDAPARFASWGDGACDPYPQVGRDPPR